LAKGDFVTFLWSDDYIAPRFLSVLVPPLRDGSALAVGRGLMRDLDDETALPFDPGSVRIDPVKFLDGYFRRGLNDGVFRPVSPACSLFSRAAFDTWIDQTEEWCQATPLRRELHWRRAIGPDLLLFLVAIRMTQGKIFVANDVTAQFSHHPGSFSVAASNDAYETGYWLARLWYPHSCEINESYPAAAFAGHVGATISIGFILALMALWRRSRDGFADSVSIFQEIGCLWPIVLRHGATARVLLQAPHECCRLLTRFLLRPQHS
jgi:hypothetical protein